MLNQYGLALVDAGMVGLEPQWTVKSNIAKVEAVARKHLKLDRNASCCVSHYAQGGFNKLYKVETEAGCFLMRVTQPVDPSHKTNSEVATTSFICESTDIPVPYIFTYDDSSNNKLGFEWIEMEMLPGSTLQTKWRKLSAEAKQNVVKEAANYQVQLFRHKFDAIGDLFLYPEDQRTSRGVP